MPNHTHGVMDTMTSSAASSTYAAGNCGCTCSSCGGLECLCRPRFFPGQLLTDEDLNRLDHYIVAKNKLHNRYLFGTGVVCGLEVVCHPCAGEVTVRSGYALSPCGDDIIVCKDVRVNVCDLIMRCKPPTRECEPFGTSEENCKDLTEKWLLAICYDEKPSRGMAALRADTQAPCCSRCSCGGSSTCGCSCHEKRTDKKNGCAPLSRRTPPQCEPTVLCEGYRFALFKPPKATDKDNQSNALAQRIEDCKKHVEERIPPPPTAGSFAEVHEWCCRVKDSLRELFATMPVHDCQLAQRISVLCPPPPSPNTPGGLSVEAYLKQVQANLASLVFEFVRDCSCSALLPPCPNPGGDSCVVLASIEVRKHDCAILRICNWEGRNTLVTFPTLGYWLGPLLQPFLSQLQQLTEQKCCGPARG